MPRIEFADEPPKVGKPLPIDRRRIESLALIAAVIATQPGYTEEPEDAVRRADQYLRLAEEFLLVKEAL
jgi:hypothetical protein